MFRRVTVRRIVAATDVTADLAQAKVQPLTADLQTILAAIRARSNDTYLAQVITAFHIVYKFILTTRGRLFNVMAKRYEPLVRVAPCPVLARLERRHDRVIGLVKMFCRVLVSRRIAATDMTALETHAKMNPLVIILHTFLAALR
jgi:hypothetical protein